MKIGFFKRIIAFLLLTIVVFSLFTTLISCSKRSDDDKNNSSDNASSLYPEAEEEKYNYLDRIVFPEFKDYGRETVDFDKIEYKRPNFDLVTEKTHTVISAIEKNEITFEEQIAMIEELEEYYNDILTMRNYADIQVAKDSSSKYWTDEYAYITGSYPSFANVVEDMYVAAANSPHNERFESEYFGDGLIEEYKDGGKLTDELVALFEKEEELENAYITLASPESNESSSGENALKHRKTEIFIELVKVRKQIADEFGHKTYATYAYESLGRDYSAEKASRLLDDICEYILPTYQILSYTTLAKYVYNDGSVKATKLKLEDLINNSRSIVIEFDEEYGEIYDYMLQHRLFDVERKTGNRNDGAFVTYLNDYEAPFLFLSANGDINDYQTYIHEFGHFIDSYINYNSKASIDQKEISSQAFEYLSLTAFDGILSESDRRYLVENQMLNAMITLIFQGFYAKAEELIYSLPMERITKEELDAAVLTAAEAFSLNTKYINDLSAIFITHTFLYPFYVQSYCTSLIPALEIYFMEIENEGSGIEAYKKLIDRNGENFTLEEALADAGIASPFKEDIVLELAGKILSYVNTGKLPEKKNDDAMGAAA